MEWLEEWKFKRELKKGNYGTTKLGNLITAFENMNYQWLPIDREKERIFLLLFKDSTKDVLENFIDYLSGMKTVEFKKHERKYCFQAIHTKLRHLLTSVTKIEYYLSEPLLDLRMFIAMEEVIIRDLIKGDTYQKRSNFDVRFEQAVLRLNKVIDYPFEELIKFCDQQKILLNLKGFDHMKDHYLGFIESKLIELKVHMKFLSEEDLQEVVENYVKPLKLLKEKLKQNITDSKTLIETEQLF